jgi:glycerol-3-phosphate dehydrogenase
MKKAGLRVLPSIESQNLSGADSINSRSRETILHTGRQDNLSLLTIYGGKVTTYRLTAERVMARVSKMVPVRKVIADTRHLKI